jgi:hypothetical protein
MKVPPTKSTTPAPEHTPSVTPIVASVLTPLIAVLSSPALASGPSGQPSVTVGGQGPMLDPPALIAAGTAIASIGAYRLMRMRGRKPSDEKGANDE